MPFLKKCRFLFACALRTLGFIERRLFFIFYEMPVSRSSEWQGSSLCLPSQYLGATIFFLARRIRDKKRKIRLETTLSPKRENAFSGNLMGIALPIPSQFLFLILFENSCFRKMQKMIFWLHSTCDRSAEVLLRDYHRSCMA